MFKKSCIFLLLVFCLLLSSCSEPNKNECGSFDPLKGEEIETFKNDEKIEKFIEQRAAELKAKWDAGNAESEIAKLNNTRGNENLSEDTKKLLLDCISLSKKTDGLFDITLYPLIRLWGFDTNEPKIPQEMLVSLMASKCGMDTISVADNKFVLDQFTMISVNAVINGNSADVIAAELEKDGAEAALIKIGSHVRTVGNKVDGKKWNVALKDPFKEDQIFSCVSVDGGLSVSTRGTFQNYFEEDGKRYCDVFDPRNGNPIENDLASVTVICESGITADAFANASLVMGSKEASEFYRDNGNFEIIMVLNDGKVKVSEGIADAVVFATPDQDVEVIKK